ncbi:hypothetical protein ACOSQ4_008474 [Xanthoceras sorbifolium]
MESPSDPLLSNSNTKPKGGLRTMPFIIANEAFERVASFGLSPNMILYLTREYNMENSRASNVILLWSAATNFLPVVGAIVADSYVGRYPMIGFGSITSLLGMIMLWLTTIFPAAKPSPCIHMSCESPTTSQLMLLYTSFAFMSIGAGGIRSCSLAFGADQLDRGDSLENAGSLQTYFNWYGVVVTFSSIVALTCVVYIQDNLGWAVGFGVPVVLMLLSLVSFFLATPFYVKLKADSNLLSGLAQAVVASYKNRHINQSTDDTYHVRKDSMLLVPSDKLRFLNKACTIRDPQQDLTPDGEASDPWSLCTVDQVEELKALIKVIPIWAAGIMLAVNITQTFMVIQASSMDRHITPNFEIPAGSLNIFMVITLTLWIGLYDRIFVPLASRIRRKPTYLSTRQRMGIGLLFSSLSMASWAIVEGIRRDRAIKEGFSDNPQAVVDVSAMWLLPHFVMDGLAEAFYSAAVNQFFYTEFPKTMSSIATSLIGVGMSVANLVASVILNAVDCVTKIGGNESWVSDNINKGHYDYYLWLLAGFSLANFLYYLACSKTYGPCKSQVNKKIDQ